MTQLYIIRHGETYFEAADRVKGQLDIPLDPRGRRQAAAVAEYFRGARASVIYSATLVRARQTAQPIAEATGCLVLPTPLLNERHWGVWQGLTSAELRRERASGGMGPDHSAPLGERWHTLAERVRWFLELVARGRAGQTVIAVTHGGVIKDMVMPALGVRPTNRSAFAAETGTVSLLEHDGRLWRSVFLNADPTWAAGEHPPGGCVRHIRGRS
jgi:probable phosphoglycerate mutase